MSNCRPTLTAHGISTFSFADRTKTNVPGCNIRENIRPTASPSGAGGLQPKLKRVENGVVEILVEPKDARTRQMFLLVLLAALGHGIYL
jgi:hypothetical protein